MCTTITMLLKSCHDHMLVMGNQCGFNAQTPNNAVGIYYRKMIYYWRKMAKKLLIPCTEVFRFYIVPLRTNHSPCLWSAIIKICKCRWETEYILIRNNELFNQFVCRGICLSCQRTGEYIWCETQWEDIFCLEVYWQ